jgi:hypothetical protein
MPLLPLLVNNTGPYHFRCRDFPSFDRHACCSRQREMFNAENAENRGGISCCVQLYRTLTGTPKGEISFNNKCFTCYAIGADVRNMIGLRSSTGSIVTHRLDPKDAAIIAGIRAADGSNST